MFIYCWQIHAQLARDSIFHSKYHLDKIAIVGRHHIRSAIVSNGERRITPHQWHKWTEGEGQLTVRGGLLEKEMGKFYRQWLLKEGLFGNSHIPVAKQVRLYANSMQRTVETGRSFALGFLPDSILEVDYDKSVKFGSMSPVFYDVSTKLNDIFNAKIVAEVNETCYPEDFETCIKKLEEDAVVIARVLDMEQSPACQQNDTCSFLFTNPYIYLHLKWMPTIRGGNIYLAQLTSSNLILQYYDMPETQGSIFDNPVTYSDLCAIGRVKDIWCFLSMGQHTIGRDIAHPLLIRLKEEIEDPSIKFSYLIGHDSNMSALTGALDIEKYYLSETPEVKTPLGGKMTIEIWKDVENNSFVALNYCYQSVSQILELTPLSLDTPPIIHPLKLKKILSNEDGLYAMDDFMRILNNAIDEYDHLEENLKIGDVNHDDDVNVEDVMVTVDYVLKHNVTNFHIENADINNDGSIDISDVMGIVAIVLYATPAIK